MQCSSARLEGGDVPVGQEEVTGADAWCGVLHTNAL